MTERLKPEGMVWDAVGPGIGIQTKLGEHAGRLVIPAIGRNIYSDDHGEHWKYQIMPTIDDRIVTSEGTIVELTDGRLMRNDRPNGATWENISKRRWVSRGS